MQAVHVPVGRNRGKGPGSAGIVSEGDNRECSTCMGSKSGFREVEEGEDLGTVMESW